MKKTRLPFGNLVYHEHCCSSTTTNYFPKDSIPSVIERVTGKENKRIFRSHESPIIYFMCCLFY